MKPPVFEIDPKSFWQNPYPALAEMRKTSPICFVPQLNATLFTKRDDIFTCEKMVDVFSSDQPGGLMTVLMGENMMRKDGEQHLLERKQTFPALSPRTVRDLWKAKFQHHTAEIIASFNEKSSIDLVTDYAMPVSAHALRHITGLTNLKPEEMDFASQGMIDGVGNYAGDPEIEKRCHTATRLIDDAIDDMMAAGTADPSSMLRVLTQTDQPMDSIRANIKLAISGGQNEPRDAISGAVSALLSHPHQLDAIRTGQNTWLQAFEEYARWMSPIGMSPRRVAKHFVWNGIELEAESRVFFMFGSANRDESIFEKPDHFDISRDTAKAISFGAGPHFCAGAAASRTLIAEVALPMLFNRFPDMRLAKPTQYSGWAFRGPLSTSVKLD
jgi:cytochrome P450